MITFNKVGSHVRSDLWQLCFHWCSESSKGQKHNWRSRVNILFYHKTPVHNSWQHKDKLNRLGRQIPIEKHGGIMSVADKTALKPSIRVSANKIASGHSGLYVSVSRWNYQKDVYRVRFISLRIFWMVLLSLETALPKHVKWEWAMLHLS